MSFIINESNEVKNKTPNFFRRNGFDENLLNYSNSMIHGALIIKAKVIKNNLYNEDFYFSQDFELYHRLMTLGFKIIYDKNNITYKLRIHGESISRKNSKKQIELYRSIFSLNNKRFFEPTIINRAYFKIIEIIFFIKKKII